MEGFETKLEEIFLIIYEQYLALPLLHFYDVGGEEILRNFRMKNSYGIWHLYDPRL